MSAIKPHLAQDGESTPEERSRWNCGARPEEGLGRFVAEGTLCPTDAAILNPSHASLLNTAYAREIVLDGFKGSSIVAVIGEGEKVYLEVSEPVRTPAWNPASNDPLRRSRLLSWTTKMGCPSYSLPAGPGIMAGSCPGSTAGMTVVPENLRRNAARNVLKVLGRGASDPIDPANCVCQFCYAEGGQYGASSVQFAQVLRLLWTQKAVSVDVRGVKTKNPEDSLFVAVMRRAIQAEVFDEKNEPSPRAGKRFFRLHDSGDFFSVAYLRAWKAVANSFPDITFWAPTRVWALGDVERNTQGSWTRRGWVEAVNQINGPADESNLIIRASAFEVNRHGPDERLGSGWSACSTVYTPESKGDSEGFDWDCKAYLAPNGPMCRDAEAPPEVGDKGKKIGCRACWVRTDLKINYTLH